MKRERVRVELRIYLLRCNTSQWRTVCRLMSLFWMWMSFHTRKLSFHTRKCSQMKWPRSQDFPFMARVQEFSCSVLNSHVVVCRFENGLYL